MRFLYCKSINIITVIIISLNAFSHANNPLVLKDEEKKQTLEFRMREYLRDVNLFEYSKWSSIESAYFAEMSKSKRDKMVIEHFHSLYKQEIIKFSKKKRITNAAEFSGILGGLIGSAAIGPVLGYANANAKVVRVLTGLGMNVAVWGAMIWPMMETSPTSSGEHGPISLVKNAIKAGQYANGKTLEDPYVHVEEIFAKAYFNLHEYQPLLFEKTKKMLKKMRSDSAEHIHNYQTYVETAASLPLGIYNYPSDEAYLTNAFKNYSDDVIESLDYLTSTFLFWSNNEHLTSNEEHPFYFEGVPGAGKTHAAKSLAKGLGTTMVTVALDGADYEAIVGQKFDPHSAKERGRMLEAFVKVKPVGDSPYALNSIMFIDEFDRLLNADDYPSRQVLSFMLKTLDPANRSFYSPYLGVDIQLPNLIILAGNYAITDEALTNRFETIKFDGFDYEGKMTILNDSILPKALKSFGLTKRDLTESDREKFENIVRDSMSDRGLRTIEKNINKLLMKKTGKRNDVPKNR